MSAITESLLENSKSAIISCIELHNKPTFSYRYEICTILAINGWELLLKAFIAQNYPEVRIIRKDGSTKPFEECIAFVSGELGNDFKPIEENLNKLYEFRCHIIHFYKESIDVILYSLLHKSILFYNSFVMKHFNLNLSENTNLMLLPIGFKPFASPVDFLSKESALSQSSNAVKVFIESIVESTQRLNDQGIEESILTSFNMAVINENRIKNADIIAGITKNETEAKLTVSNIIGNAKISNEDDAKKINIQEETLFKTIYTLSYQSVIDNCKIIFSDFKQNAQFNRIMRQMKTMPNIHRKRYLDVINKTGVARDYYSQDIFKELEKHYRVKED